jgi:hypothetical protein
MLGVTLEPISANTHFCFTSRGVSYGGATPFLFKATVLYRGKGGLQVTLECHSSEEKTKYIDFWHREYTVSIHDHQLVIEDNNNYAKNGMKELPNVVYDTKEWVSQTYRGYSYQGCKECDLTLLLVALLKMHTPLRLLQELVENSCGGREKCCGDYCVLSSCYYSLRYGHSARDFRYGCEDVTDLDDDMSDFKGTIFRLTE